MSALSRFYLSQGGFSFQPKKAGLFRLLESRFVSTLQLSFFQPFNWVCFNPSTGFLSTLQLGLFQPLNWVSFNPKLPTSLSLPILCRGVHDTLSGVLAVPKTAHWGRPTFE